jgi:hypothetical protein
VVVVGGWVVVVVDVVVGATVTVVTGGRVVVVVVGAPRDPTGAVVVGGLEIWVPVYGTATGFALEQALISRPLAASPMRTKAPLQPLDLRTGHPSFDCIQRRLSHLWSVDS